MASTLNTTVPVSTDADPGGITQKTFSTLIIFLAAQAVIGIVAFEYAWSRTKRFRNVDERRDALYPNFRRNDAKNWARWKFYIGAMFFMPTRFILLFIDGIFLTTVVS
jgi:hypothetical protein